MANNNKSFLENALGDMDSPVAQESSPKPQVRVNQLDKRVGTLNKMASGTLKNVQLHLVDPSECKIREDHNRDYSALTYENCQSLIESIKAQEGQEIPAIVRKLDGDPEFNYEVVSGARRHFAISWLRANNYPSYRYLIEIRNLTDEEVFRLSDIENREREDISDYERAIEYSRALDQFYKTQTEMAGRMEKTVSWLSNYISLANLPNEVIDAFPERNQIKARYANDLRPLLKSPSRKEALIKRAVEIKADIDGMRESGAKLPTAITVLRLLKTKPKQPAKRTTKTYKTKSGVDAIQVKRSSETELSLTISVPAMKDEQGLLQVFTEVLKDHNQKRK